MSMDVEIIITDYVQLSTLIPNIFKIKYLKINYFLRKRSMYDN